MTWSVVNGKRIKKCVLKDGDKLAFGPYKMLFHMDTSTLLDDTPDVSDTTDNNVVVLEDTIIRSKNAANIK